MSDLYPPAPGVDPANPNARASYSAIKDRGFKVTRVVGGRGAVVPFRWLAAAMEKG